jgi:hypothetical protein
MYQKPFPGGEGFLCLLVIPAKAGMTAIRHDDTAVTPIM